MSFEFIYNDSILLGTQTDGVLTELPPVPTGDELDELLDACCHTIENMFGSYKRLHSDLQLSDGQHSLILTDGRNKLDMAFGHDGVRSWITRGTLRSVNDLTPVLNSFLSDMTKKVRLRKVQPDWKFDNASLIIISSRFGLQAPRTFAELAAKREADDTDRERRRIERAETDRVAREKYLASPEGREATRRSIDEELRRGIVETVLTAIVGEFDSIHLSKEATDAELNAARGRLLDWKAEHRRVEPKITEVVKATKWTAQAIIDIWREQERGYADLLDTVEDNPKALARLPEAEDYCMKALVDKANESITDDTQPVPWTPSEIPPVIDGVNRTLMTRQQWYDESRTNEDKWFRLDNRIVTYLDDNRNFVIDDVPETLWEAYDIQCRVHDAHQSMLAKREGAA
jgi:hypothetical protein